MTELSGTYQTKRNWYNNYKFPLIPFIETRKANEHNTSSFQFHWLFFQIWTMDSFCFEFSLVADEHWGIGVIGMLPYLRWVITIPCPVNIQMWVQKNLWRKCKSSQIRQTEN